MIINNDVIKVIPKKEMHSTDDNAINIELTKYIKFELTAVQVCI